MSFLGLGELLHLLQGMDCNTCKVSDNTSQKTVHVNISRYLEGSVLVQCQLYVCYGGSGDIPA